MMLRSWFVWNSLLLTGSVIYSYGAETQATTPGLTSTPNYNNNEDYPSYNDDYPDGDYPGPDYYQGDGRDGRSLDGGEIPDPTTDDNLLKQLESTIPGIPGVDYPLYQSVPETSFRCDSQRNPGFYGDVESQCQVFHICQEDDRHDSFLCPIGTVFNQMNFICDWWFNFKCTDTPTFFHLNTKFYTPSGSATPGSVGIRETVKKMRRFRETNRDMPSTMKFPSSSRTDRKKIQEMTEKRMKNMNLNRIMNLFSPKMRSENIWKRLMTTTSDQIDGGLKPATSSDTADFNNEDIKSLGSTDLLDITSEHLMNLFSTTAASMETLTQSFPPELRLHLTDSMTTPNELDVSIRESTSNPAPTFNELGANGTVMSSTHANTTSLDRNEIDIVFTIPTITDLSTNSTLPTDTSKENYNLIFSTLDLNSQNSSGILMSFPEEMNDIHNTESMNDQLIKDILPASTPTSISSTNPQMALSLNSTTASNSSLTFGNDTHISVSVTIRATAGISRLKWKRIPEVMKRKNLTAQNTPVKSLNSENNDSLMDLVFRKRMMRNKKLKSRIMWIPAKNDTLKRKSHWRIFVNSRPQTVRTGDTKEFQYQKMDLIKNTIAPIRVVNDASDEISNLKPNAIHVDETILSGFKDPPSTTLKMENTEVAFTVMIPSESSILNSSHISKISPNNSNENHRQDKNQDGKFEDSQEINRGEKFGDSLENIQAESVEGTQDSKQSDKFGNSGDNNQGEKIISSQMINEREKFINQREKSEDSQDSNQSKEFDDNQKLNEREKFGYKQANNESEKIGDIHEIWNFEDSQDNNQSEMHEGGLANDQGEKIDLSDSIEKQSCKKICIKLLRNFGGTDTEKDNGGPINSFVESRHNSTMVGTQSLLDTDMKAQFRRSSLDASLNDQWSVKYDPGPKCDENEEDGKIFVKGWSVIIDAGSVTKEKTVKRRGCDNIFNDSKIIVMQNLTPYHKTPSKKNYPETNKKSNLRFGSMDQQYWLTLVKNWLEASPNSEIKTVHHEKSTNEFPTDDRFHSNIEGRPDNFKAGHFFQTDTKGNENNFQLKKDNSWKNIQNVPKQHFTAERISDDLHDSATNKQINTRNSKFDRSKHINPRNDRQPGPNQHRQFSANRFNQDAVHRRKTWSDTGTKWTWRNDRDSDVMTSQSDRNEWHVNIEDKNQNDKSDRRDSSRGDKGNVSDNWKNERAFLPRDLTPNWTPASMDDDITFTPQNGAYGWSSSETNRNSFSKPTNGDWSSNDKIDDAYYSSEQPSYSYGRSLGSNDGKDIPQQNSNPNWSNDNVRGKRDWDSQQQNRKSPTSIGDGQASKNSWSSSNRPSNKGNDNSDWSSQPHNMNRWSSDSEESRSFPVSQKDNDWSSGSNEYKSEAAAMNARYPIDTRIMTDWSYQSRNDDWSSSSKRSDDNWSPIKDKNKDVSTPLDKFDQDTRQNPRIRPQNSKDSWPSPEEKDKKSWDSGDQKLSRNWNSKTSNAKRDWSSSSKGDITWTSKDQQEKTDLTSDSKPDKSWSSRDQQEKAGWSSGTKKDIAWSSGDQQEKADWSSGTKKDMTWSSGDQQEKTDWSSGTKKVKDWSSGDQQDKSDWSSSNRKNKDWSTSIRTDGRKQLPNYPQSKGDGASLPRNGKDQFSSKRKGTDNKGTISKDSSQWPLNTQKDISDMSFDKNRPKIDDWSSKHQKDEPVWGSDKTDRPSSVKKPDDDWFVDNGKDESWSSSSARTDESNRRQPDTQRDKNDWALSSRKDKDDWSDSKTKLSAENWKDDKNHNKQGGNSDWSSESRSGSSTGFDEDNANWSSDNFKNNPDWSSSTKGSHEPPVQLKGSTKTQEKRNWNSGSKNQKDNIPSDSGFQNPTWSTSADRSSGSSFGRGRKPDTQNKTKQWATGSKGSSRNPSVATSDWSSKSKGDSNTSQRKDHDITPGRQSSWKNDNSQSSFTYPLNRRDEMNLNWSWDSDPRADSRNNYPKLDESSGPDSAYEDNWSSNPTGNRMSKTNKGDWSSGPKSVWASESTSNRMSRTNDGDWSSDTKAGWSSEPTRNQMPKKKEDDWANRSPNPTEKRKSKTNKGSGSDWRQDSPSQSGMKGQNRDGVWDSKGRTKTAMVMPTNSKGSLGVPSTKPWKDDGDQPKNVKSMKGDASTKDDKIVWSLQISSNGQLGNGWVPITLRPNLKKPNNQTRNQNNDKGSPKNNTDWSGVIQQMDRWGDEGLSKNTPTPPFKMDIITETIPSSSQMPDASDSHPFYIPLVNRRHKRESKRTSLTKNNIRPRQAARRIYKVIKNGKAMENNKTDEDHRFYLARADILVGDNISRKENPTMGTGTKKILKNLFSSQNKFNETIQNSIPSLIRIKGIRNSRKRESSALTHSDLSEEYGKKENSAIPNLGISEGHLGKEHSAIKYVDRSENQKKEALTSRNVNGLQVLEKENSSLRYIGRSQDLRKGNSIVRDVDQSKKDLMPENSHSIKVDTSEENLKRDTSNLQSVELKMSEKDRMWDSLMEESETKELWSSPFDASNVPESGWIPLFKVNKLSNNLPRANASNIEQNTTHPEYAIYSAINPDFFNETETKVLHDSKVAKLQSNHSLPNGTVHNNHTTELLELLPKQSPTRNFTIDIDEYGDQSNSEQEMKVGNQTLRIIPFSDIMKQLRRNESSRDETEIVETTSDESARGEWNVPITAAPKMYALKQLNASEMQNRNLSSSWTFAKGTPKGREAWVMVKSIDGNESMSTDNKTSTDGHNRSGSVVQRNNTLYKIIVGNRTRQWDSTTEDRKGREDISSKNKSSHLVGKDFSFDLKDWHKESSWTPLIRAIGSVTTKKVDNGKSRISAN